MICTNCYNRRRFSDTTNGPCDRSSVKLHHWVCDDKSNDHINPPHYKGDYVMRIIEDFKLDFLDGQVIKYLLRAGNKPSSTPLEDHEKAKWYLDRKVTNLKK